jgi:hypothetical protein
MSDPSYPPESIWCASALGLPLPQSQKPQVDAFDVSRLMQFYKLQESDQKHTVCQRPHRSCTGRAVCTALVSSCELQHLFNMLNPFRGFANLGALNDQISALGPLGGRSSSSSHLWATLPL